MRHLPLMLASLALSLPTLAQAQATEILAIVDANGDGAIARDEVIALRLAVFARIDADSDGTLTRAEIAEAQAKAAERRAARDPFRLDADGDDRLTTAEFTAALPGFDRADQDGDGLLSPSEIDRVRGLLGTFGAGLE